MGTKQDSDVMTTDELAYRTALDGMRESLKAMPEEELERRLTVDPSAAALIVGAALTKVEPLREELDATFAGKGTQVIDELRVVALATRQADVELTMAASVNDLSKPFEQLKKTQQLLLADTDALALRGYLDPARLEPARNAQGYLAVVDSVERLVSLLRESWSTIEGHTPMVEADLDRAVVQAKRLSATIAGRENGANRAPALETRLRVVSRLMRLYDSLLRMVTYVRWRQDDAEQFVPSLWATRGRRARTPRGLDPNADAPVDPSSDAGDPRSLAGPVPINGTGPFTA